MSAIRYCGPEDKKLVLAREWMAGNRANHEMDELCKLIISEEEAKRPQPAIVFECKIGRDLPLPGHPDNIESVQDVCRTLSAVITELLRKDVRECTFTENNIFIEEDGPCLGWYSITTKKE